jgi:two-component system cell cycle sensor histidine kinase/response regulator CckA
MRVQSVVRDITERKRADEALKASSELFDKFMMHSPIYAFINEVTPEHSLVLYSSENFVDMIGVPGSQMVGKTMHAFFPPEFADKITADDWDVVFKGEMVTLEEELNGRNYTSIKFPILQDEHTLLAGYTIDITERKKPKKPCA